MAMRSLWVGALASLALGAAFAEASNSDPASEQELTALRQQVTELAETVTRLRDRVDELESVRPAGTVPVQGVTDSSPPTVLAWQAEEAVPRLRFGGDFRYRAETIRIAEQPDRDRQRFRARLRARLGLSDTVTVGLGLSSGGASPASGTQSFDDGASYKDVDFDQAFVSWRAPVPGMSVIAGKMVNPFRRVGGYDLLWDSELFPEGVAVVVERDRWFASMAEFLLEERPSSADTWLFGAQAGMHFDLGGRSRLTAGLGWFDYRGVAGRAPLFEPMDSAGNRIDAAGNYVSDFDQLEAFLELRGTVFEQPLLLFGDLVNNTGAEAEDFGYAAGIRLGAGEPGRPWRVGYAYQDLEADAVLGLFTGTDFAGGGTGKWGHRLRLDYALGSRVMSRVTWYANQRLAADGGSEDYDRVQLELNLNW